MDLNKEETLQYDLQDESLKFLIETKYNGIFSYLNNNTFSCNFCKVELLFNKTPNHLERHCSSKKHKLLILEKSEISSLAAIHFEKVEESETKQRNKNLHFTFPKQETLTECNFFLIFLFWLHLDPLESNEKEKFTPHLKTDFFFSNSEISNLSSLKGSISTQSEKLDAIELKINNLHNEIQSFKNLIKFPDSNDRYDQIPEKIRKRQESSDPFEVNFINLCSFNSFLFFS